MTFRGRPFTRPYTPRGIKRAKCRCGKPARTQWQVCSNGNRWLPLCPACDFTLNQVALLLAMGDTPEVQDLLDRYKAKLKRLYGEFEHGD